MIKKQEKYYNYKNEELSEKNETLLLDSNSKIADDNIWIQIKKSLNEDAYDCLWLFYVEQMTIKEIAQVLQRSQSWVKISLFRSKKKLSKNTVIQNLSEDII